MKTVTQCSFVFSPLDARAALHPHRGSHHPELHRHVQRRQEPGHRNTRGYAGVPFMFHCIRS